jgi:hypothetical protein
MITKPGDPAGSADEKKPASDLAGQYSSVIIQ